MNTEFSRFIVVGLLNTMSTYVLYLLLMAAMSYKLAYSIAYVSGILLSYYLNARVVFRSQLRIVKLIQYPTVYVVQYVMNILTLWVLVDYLSVPTALAPIIVIVATVPVTFVLSRLIVKDRPPAIQETLSGEIGATSPDKPSPIVQES
jgi:putative flippase GtrA